MITGQKFASMDGFWLWSFDYNANVGFYNAVAIMAKWLTQFVSEIKEWNKTIKKYEKEVLNPEFAPRLFC
jgi:hypothetical protein